MKKALPILLFLLFAAAVAQSQNCMRDSSIYGTNTLISPATYSPAHPIIETPPACIGEPYALSVTLNVPDTFSSGAISAPLDSVIIAPSGAITKMPPGLSYVCDPPNCHFKKNTLGCILIQGTPLASDTVGLYDVAIALQIYASGFPIPIGVTFPGTIAPDNHFYIRLRAMGQCIDAANDLSSKIGSLKNVPNPFTDLTEIKVNSLVSGDFKFEVFDLLGQRVYAEPMHLIEGDNQFTFDAGDLANGSYFFSISNNEGRAVRQMVIVR